MIGRPLTSYFTVAALGACLFTATYFLILLPLGNWRQSTLDRQIDLVNDREQLEGRVAQLEAEKQSFVSDDLEGLIWEGEQQAEATAKVQSAINDIARDNGILMRSIAPTNNVDIGIPNAISFRLEFEASLDQLVSFLKTIEFGQPALVVTRANTRRLVRPGQASLQPELFVQLDIAAPISISDGSGG